MSADEVRAAIDTLRADHGIDYARGKKSKRLDLDHTLVGYELTAGERPDHLVLMLDTHADNEALCVRKFCFPLLMFCCRA